MHGIINLLHIKIEGLPINPFPNMDDNPLRIAFRNRINGSLNRFEVPIAIDIDLNCAVGANFLCQ